MTRLPTFRLLGLAAVLLTANNSFSPASALSSAAAAADTQPHGFTTVNLPDPSLNGVTAETLTIPGGWKFQGIMATPACTSLPFPIFRAYAPDGLTEMRAEPAMGWHWGPHAVSNAGCLPLNGPMSAGDFLDHYVGTLQGAVHVVGRMNPGEQFRAMAQKFAQNADAAPVIYEPARFTHSADVAALRVETRNGTFVIEQRLRVAIECAVNNHPGPLEGGNCFALLGVLRAPKGKLDALMQLVDSNSLPKVTQSPQWQQAVMQREQQRDQAAIATMNRMQQQAAASLQAMHQQFMATMQRNNEAFRAQQEDKFNHFQQNMAAQQQARDNSVSDWVDFALDRQTFSGAGGVVHTSNDFTHNWSNGQNQWFQTNDPNANPNGTLSGNWTEDTKVHGNGQSY